MLSWVPTAFSLVSKYYREVIFVVIFGVLYLGYNHYENLQQSLIESQTKIVLMEESLKEQNRTINQLQFDTTQIRLINQDINSVIYNQSSEMDQLRNLFSRSTSGEKREVGKIAREKPTLVEQRVNIGSKHATRCLELASGASRTEEELNATKPSEINTICPRLANPNFITLN